ncbi:hypothetical protein RIR_jg9761.t1 [Rhizophagus irregularis DAOM 181602=DAOM 197198]|uniref:Uncharacterized protein n=1 Tax=Rhizophagus irregularis (strain DAOM 181602 / DAOM 197198 / MUCL 43194) TaxID=747089 RepID=U9UQ21_RHIID|nr:hypothetical protein RIR_jg9761.t1 [Rhizophagus irregularis DAOM 181602=DAOM 197198]
MSDEIFILIWNFENLNNLNNLGFITKSRQSKSCLYIQRSLISENRYSIISRHLLPFSEMLALNVSIIFTKRTHRTHREHI